MASADLSPPDPPKGRKSLFKRTVPRKKQVQQSPEAKSDDKPQDENNDLDFFKRSKDVFPMVLQEVLEEQKPPSPGRHDRKRRKLSAEPETSTALKKDSSPANSGLSEGRQSSFIGLDSDSDSDVIVDIKGKGKEIVKLPKPSTPRKSGLEAHRASPGIIEVEDDDDDPHVSPSRLNQTERVTRASSRLLRLNSSPVDLADRDYQAEAAAGDSSDLEEIQPPSDDDPLDEELSAWVAKAQQRQAVPNPDVIIQLTLDTWIMNQRDVANFTISKEEASKMFLTWKGHKIYGHSTPASLGIQVTDRGEVKGTGKGFKKGAIHLEAWTDEGYSLYLEQERTSKLQLIDGNEEFDPDLLEPSPPPPPKKKGIRVTLKARAFESLNITVHEDTTVATIIEAFRTQREVGPGRKVEIWFDGERLDDDSLVKDADIDPDETNQLEVHVK